MKAQDYEQIEPMPEGDYELLDTGEGAFAMACIIASALAFGSTCFFFGYLFGGG